MNYEKIAELAHKALQHFFWDQSLNAWNIRPGAPSWVFDLARHAHNGALPNNWKFRFLYVTLTNLENTRTEAEWSEPELYPSETWSELLNWLRDDPHATSFVNDTIHEFIGEGLDLFDLLQLAQQQEMSEVYDLATIYLHSLVEEQEEVTA